MAVQTEALDFNYRQKWNWKVEIDGYERAFFNTIDRPKAQFEVVEINPGGTHRPVKLPGRVTFGDLTAERGVLNTNDPDFVAWLEKCQAFADGGASDADFNNIAKTIDIVEYDAADNEVDRWRLHGAWISQLDGNNLDGSASEQTTESLTITYQYFQRNP